MSSCPRASSSAAAALDGVGDQGGELHPFLAELDLAPGDAGDVQQVVHQARHVAGLPAGERESALPRRRILSPEAQDLQGVQDG